MKLTCKFGTDNLKKIDVQPSDQICILIEKLNLKDKKSKFIFQGETYQVATILTFKEIGLVDDYRINIINAAIAGIA
jgi:hypothetical protein